MAPKHDTGRQRLDHATVLIARRLSGGDRRSIGQADAVAGEVEDQPELFGGLFACLRHPDEVVRMRAADAIEKASRVRPELLQPYRQQLLHEIAPHPQQEIRWHVAQLLPRLALSAVDRNIALQILNGYLEDKSSITRTNAMQALADFAERDLALRPAVVAKLTELTEVGTPAMRSRGRKLVAQLVSPSQTGDQ